MDDHEGKEVTCTGEMYCPGSDSLILYTDESPCKWKRKLCVTCSEDDDGKVFVRVQSNTLPNHCFVSSDQSPAEANTDW